MIEPIATPNRSSALAWIVESMDVVQEMGRDPVSWKRCAMGWDGSIDSLPPASAGRLRGELMRSLAERSLPAAATELMASRVDLFCLGR